MNIKSFIQGLNIKSFIRSLNRFSFNSLVTTISIRTLISFAGWAKFFSAYNAKNVADAVIWQMIHGNWILNWMHGIWLYNHAAFAIALHWATFLIGVFAFLLFASTIANIAFRAFSNKD